MSQKKVDAYKEQKAHRAEIMRKEKRMRRLQVTALVVVLAALVGWFGFAVYRQAQANKEVEVETREIRTGAIQSYMEELESGDELATDETEEIEEATLEDIESADGTVEVESADDSVQVEEVETTSAE